MIPAVLALGLTGGPGWTFVKFMSTAHAVTAPPAGHASIGVIFPPNTEATINNLGEVALHGYLPKTSSGSTPMVFYKGATGNARVVAYDGQPAPTSGNVNFTSSGTFPTRSLRIGNVDPSKAGSTDVVSFHNFQGTNQRLFRWNTSELALKELLSPLAFAVDGSYNDIARTSGSTFWHGRLGSGDAPGQIWKLNTAPAAVNGTDKSGVTNVASATDAGDAVAYFDNADNRFEVKTLGATPTLNPIPELFWGEFGAGGFGGYGPTQNYTPAQGVAASSANGEVFAIFAGEIGVYPGFYQDPEFAPGLLIYRSVNNWYGVATTPIRAIVRIGDFVTYSPAGGGFSTAKVVSLSPGQSALSLTSTRDAVFKLGLSTDADANAEVEAIYAYQAGSDDGSVMPQIDLIANTGTAVTGITAAGQTITELNLGAKAIQDNGKVVVFTYGLSNGQRGVAKATRP